MSNILVTGGAGFIGSNFLNYMVKKYPENNFYNLDKLTYAGNLENLSLIENETNYTFIKGDIQDNKLVKSIFDKYDITTVINFAAESHVDRSIENPDIFLKTNILGTQVLLEAAKNKWELNSSDKYDTAYKNNVKFIQVSTDEVYGTLGSDGMFTEATPLNPNSPYSVSKASADLLVRAYNETYKLPINITRCSNNYGPHQFPEKLIPLMINNALEGKKLPVYGDGQQIRDWLHVKDHCTAIDKVYNEGISGEVYNIGGNNEKANIDIVKLILKKLGKSSDQIEFVTDRLGHDRRYAIDNSKITSDLKWEPSYVFETGLEETIQWYLNNQNWTKHIVTGDYMNYYKAMYNNR
ncbi:MAG: dTDP-glucose 4,6-dehydratase [Alkalibacterium sp.]|nr:dTDP-glucose 4,6-dehydratase [Alkalibacterium sp.]